MQSDDFDRSPFFDPVPEPPSASTRRRPQRDDQRSRPERERPSQPKPKPAKEPPVAVERGLPANTEAERLILGSILTDESAFVRIAASIKPEDFSLEKHRRIYASMSEIGVNGRIDRMLLIEQLKKHRHLESVDGVSYIISLDENMPPLLNLDGYIKIVREKSALRSLISAGQMAIDLAMLEMDSSDSIATDIGNRLLSLANTEEEAHPLTTRQIVDGFEGGFDSFLDPSKRKKGIATKFYRFDEWTGGLLPGCVYCFAGRPSQGKTSLACTMLLNIVSSGIPAMLFSLEMSKEILLTHMLCSMARVDGMKFSAGYLAKEERRRLMVALADLIEMPLYIDDSRSLTSHQIKAKVKRLKATVDLQVIGIDYLQLMQLPDGVRTAADRSYAVGAITRGMKKFAKDEGLAMVLLSQAGRDVEKRGGEMRPILSDIRISSHIEEDCDMIAFIHRPEFYKPDREDLKGSAELIVAKNRVGGPVGIIKMIFLKNIRKFENLYEDNPEAVKSEEPPPEEKKQKPATDKKSHGTKKPHKESDDNGEDRGFTLDPEG